MERLYPCPTCARHVRANERACPFCDAALTTPPSRVATTSGRLGRAALFAFRTSAVAALGTLAACGDDQTQTQAPVERPPEESIMQPYGAPPDPVPPVPPVPPTPRGPVLPDTTIAQPYGAPPMPPSPDVPVDPPIAPDDPPDDPPTHDQRRERPHRTVTIPAYGISPMHDDDLE